MKIYCLIPFILFICCSCTGTASLRAFDEIAPVGKNILISAKIERGFLGKDVKGATLVFEILHIPKSAKHGKPVYHKLGEAFSNEDGLATIEMKGFFKGVHLLRCSYKDNPNSYSIANIFIVDKEKPLLVCDIDHTIADISTASFLVTRIEDIPSLTGSVEALNKLAEKYLIIYLTARDDSFRNATLKWLRINNFPLGPIFFSDLSKSAFIGSAKRFKKDKIAGWRKAGLNVQVGIGDRPEDAYAYLANGMRAYIITDKTAKVPSGTVVLNGWPEIVDILLK